jgi:hypothetical protein
MTEPLDETITGALAGEAQRLRIDVPGARERFGQRVRRRRRARVAVAGAAVVLAVTAGALAWPDSGEPDERVELAGPSTSPAPVTTGLVDPPGGARPLVVATGWGVMVVDEAGAQHVVEDLSGGTADWRLGPVDVEGQPVTQRVSHASSDLRGGVVYGTDNAVVWLPSDGGREVLAWVAPLSLEDPLSESVELEDVVEIDGVVHVVYTQLSINTGTDFHGEGRLVAQPLDGGEPTIVESYTWQGTGPEWMYYDQVSFGAGTYAVVRSWNQGACVWIDLLNPDGTVQAGAGPYPEPADPDQCPYGAIGVDGVSVASLSDDGTELAVLRADGTLERYSVADGSLLGTVRLGDIAVLPSGVDYDGDTAAVVARAECDMSAGDGICGPLAIPTIGRGALTRAPIATIDASDPRWVANTADLVVTLS